jgi:hypothetical protein
MDRPLKPRAYFNIGDRVVAAIRGEKVRGVVTNIGWDAPPFVRPSDLFIRCDGESFAFPVDQSQCEREGWE